MSDKKDNPNIEWKKAGFGESEKLGLSVNTKKAEEFEAKKKNNSSPNVNKATLPVGLNKIRKKIKDIIDSDEDEDENDYQVVMSYMPIDRSLVDALSSDEKQQLQNKFERETMREQQNAGKGEAIAFMNKFAQETGMKKLDQAKMTQSLLNDTVHGKDVLRDAIKDDLAKKAGIKWQNISDQELVGFLRGVKKIHKVGGSNAVEGMKVGDVLEAGKVELKDKADEERIAKIILRKTGRDKKKREKETKKIKAAPKIRTMSEVDKSLEK